MLDQVIGFLWRDLRGLLQWTRLIRGAHQRAPEEGQHKQHAPIAGARNQQANATWAELLAQHEVNPTAD